MTGISKRPIASRFRVPEPKDHPAAGRNHGDPRSR